MLANDKGHVNEHYGDTHLLVTLKEDDTATLVTCRKVITGVIKFDGGDDVRCSCKLGEEEYDGGDEAVVSSMMGMVHEPSVMSSTSPLSPKHWAKRHWFDGVS
jgi:hypothetical protein